MFNRMREVSCFGTHFSASSVEVGLLLKGTLVALSLGILDSALSNFGKCCMLVFEDSKAFKYTSFGFLTDCSDFPPFVSVVKNHWSTHLQS